MGGSGRYLGLAAMIKPQTPDSSPSDSGSPKKSDMVLALLAFIYDRTDEMSISETAFSDLAIVGDSRLISR